MLTFGSLFAGIGGIDLGLERAGLRCCWQVEIDDYATRVLERHWPAVARYRDIRDCGAHNLASVDVAAGGFPCQGISDAGRQRGLDDPRSGLWREFARIIRELRPRYVLVENVAALLDRGMGDVLGDLAALGYDAEWSVLSSCAMGAAHTRERVFIVAYANRKYGKARLGPLAFGSPAHAPIDHSPSTRVDGMGPTPRFPRGANGVPFRMDRTERIGLAVDPRVAEFVGRAILAHAAAADRTARSAAAAG